ncbi:MAG: hypothetical protein K5639_02595 [Eubacterium sp.]|nr:hypothetical protein [Eubacterium sp.]
MNDEKKQTGLSKGAIIGIIVGGAVLLIGIIVLLIVLIMSNNKNDAADKLLENAVDVNIERKNESYDIQALDSIAAAASMAIAVNQATESGVIDLGTTSTGVTDAPFDSEQNRIQHSIFDTVSEGVGATKSQAASAPDTHIYLSYDVSKKFVSVGYSSTAPEAGDMVDGIKCQYLDESFVVSNKAE